MGRKPTHGLRNKPIYYIWASMIQRCTNPKHKRYKDYGGRGIIVCERWRSFVNFLADMGERQEGLTLDRIDNDGNYEPGNCQWSSYQQQNVNKRKNRLITFNGTTRTASQWAKISGLEKDTLLRRLYHGWSIEESLSLPVMTKREAVRRRWQLQKNKEGRIDGGENGNQDKAPDALRVQVQ